MNIPDFFHPKMSESNGTISVDFTTWDANGAEVRVALGAKVPESTEERWKVVAALRMSAWQAVWLAAQGKTGELAA